MTASNTTMVVSRTICAACRHQLRLSSSRRNFTTASALRASDADQMARLMSATTKGPSKSARIRSALEINKTPSNATIQPSSILSALDNTKAGSASALYTDAASDNLNDRNISNKPHRLHIYATKHNTHITFVQPSRSAAQTISSSVSTTSASAAAKNKVVDVLLSLSTGNIGFRKAGRGSYDAAYQLAAFVMKQIQEKGMLRDVRQLEVVLRGFGAGREAVTKVLLGSEGRILRSRITAVMDATRLKFGGDRSPNPRRLG